MRIDSLSVYNKYDKIENYKLKDELKKSNLIDKNNQIIDDNNNESHNNYLNGINTNKIITKQERQYFKNMFPESSDLIEKHILFNRNAKIQSPELRKGQLVDGIV